jgi:hypothetical protein
MYNNVPISYLRFYITVVIGQGIIKKLISTLKENCLQLIFNKKSFDTFESLFSNDLWLEGMRGDSNIFIVSYLPE